MLNPDIRQKSLKSLFLSGGHLVTEDKPLVIMPSYSPNAVTNTTDMWEDVDCLSINTPDIDPSFFDSPFKKLNSQTSVQVIDFMADDTLLMNGCQDSSPQCYQQQSYEDMNIDLSQLINQTTNQDINSSLKTSDMMVSPNDVLTHHYIPASTSPVLHYLEPKPIQSIASTINYEDLTTSTSLIDSINSQSTQESLHHYSSPSHSSHSSHSYSPLAQSYVSPSPSPALSYTSSTTSIASPPLTSNLVEVMTTCDNSNSTTIDSLLEAKPEPTFLQPTVINDHLYTLPSSSSKGKRKASTEHKDKYLTVRKKNNLASKKSRVTKRDKQKQMEDQISHYVEDNTKCRREIERMEREIEWCKNFLFKKVVASAQK